jgi:hypothetical protein
MKRGALTIIAFLACVSAGIAADFDAVLNEARSAYHRGDKTETVLRLKEAILAVWDDVPLTLTNPRLVTDPETYAPRPNNIYRAGEPIYIVGELIGYKLKKRGEIYSINIVTDFYVSDEEGKVLGGTEEFGSFEINSFIPTTDFRLDLTYTLTDAPADTYRIRTIIHDRNSSKTTEFAKLIRIQ